MAFQILAQPECNIFSNVPADGFKQIRQVRGPGASAWREAVGAQQDPLSMAGGPRES